MSTAQSEVHQLFKTFKRAYQAKAGSQEEKVEQQLTVDALEAVLTRLASNIDRLARAAERQADAARGPPDA